MEDTFKRPPGPRPNPPSPDLVAAVKKAHREQRDETVKELADALGISKRRFYECLNWKDQP